MDLPYIRRGRSIISEEERNPITAIMQLQNALKNNAPRFCQYVRSVHVFRMEEWSDVTPLIADHAAYGTPDAEEEFEEQEAIEMSEHE